MRIAVFSDIHANKPALLAATRDAWEHQVDAFYFLGDLLGRGPDPEWCGNFMLNGANISQAAWVAGNHDWLALGHLDPPIGIPNNGRTYHVGDAIKDWPVIERHRELLEANAPHLLARLRETPLLASPLPGVYLAHGMIRSSARDIVGDYAHYRTHAEESYLTALSLLPTLIAAARGAPAAGGDDGAPMFRLPLAAEPTNQDTLAIPCIGDNWTTPRLILVGHTHRACVWQRPVSAQHMEMWSDWTSAVVARTQREDGMVWFENLVVQPLFANPGSIGFTRDTQGGQASYLLVDWQDDRAGVRLRRIAFDVGSVMRRIEMLYPESAGYLLGLLHAPQT